MSLRNKLIDTHCHLDFPEFDKDRDEVVSGANQEGVKYIVNIGSSIQGSRASLELARKYDCIYAVIGIHPHEADSFSDKDISTLRDLAVQKKVVAIGEVGLDYYRNFSKRENQEKLFLAQIALAQELNLPLVIHNREAEADTLRILKQSGIRKGVVHCFSGDALFLKECFALGFLVSFTCNITYKKADSLRNIVSITPLEKIFLETDAPYLSPEGKRGLRNDPTGVKDVAEEIARIKKITVEEVAVTTANNARGFFKIK